MGTPEHAEEWIFRHRKSVKAMHIGQSFEMLHDL
jgi:hypothetical protein